MASFLSPLISLVVKKAADQLLQQFCQMWGMEENREKLHLELLGIQAKIADAEKQGASNPFVEACLKELHAAAYEAEDVLDEFQYEALRQRALREQPSSSSSSSSCSSAKVIKGFFSSENPILFRQKISGKLVKVLGKIDEVVTKMNKFNFTPRDPVPLLDRETYSFVMESEVYGRDSAKKEIVNVLLDPQRERENTSVLPIVGMGGLGKTTLAQLVYNDDRVKKHFQLLMWVCVSTEFDVVDIVKSVIQAAQMGGDVSMSSKEELRKQLCKSLDKKRYLLVLDDVWNEERGKWEEFKTLLISGASTGSVVIVTTRNKEVASITGTLPSHNLASLTEEDSWTLFRKRAFGAWDGEPSEELIEIGRTIVDKCAGLPLAVKTIGGLLGTKSDVRDWRAVAKNKIWEGFASPEVLPILKLSYDHLLPHKQQCFAFCAIFPQDYTIERDTLIRLWMANDFIPTDETRDLEDEGRHIFDELCSRSFFQDIREVESTNDPIITCKMHDLMHDLATQVAGKKCSSVIELDNPAQKEVQHLLLPDESLEISVLKQFPNIRTFLVCTLNQNKKYCYLLKSSYLRALKFSSNDRPPKELGYMRHLRYLDLSHSGFDTLPESVTKLYNLQTLDLSHSDIRELPEGMRYMTSLRNLILNFCIKLECLPSGMRYMTNLRHLFLHGCEELKQMPIGLGQLRFLRTLTNYMVDPERGVSMRELQNLNLCGRLRLRGLEKVRDEGDAKAANLAAKSGLYFLELEWDPLSETRGNDQAVLEALRPHSGLKDLVITGFCGSTFPNWMKELSVIKNLKTLSLGECTNCVELPPLWQLPSLEELVLWGMENLKFLIGGTCRHADGSEPLVTFPSLKKIIMTDLSNFENWSERNSELVNLPNLNKLQIESCPKLKTIVIQAPLLEELDLERMENLKFLVGGTCRHADGSEPLVTFPSLKKIIMTDLSNFENWSERNSELVNLPNLNKLQIGSCPKLKTIVIQAPSLEELNLWGMENLKFLVGGTCRHDDGSEPLVTFPSLKVLKITDLSNLENWSERNSELVNFPNLNQLEIWSCPKLKTLPTHVPLLEDLTIYDCSEIKLSQISTVPMLSSLFINCTIETDTFRPPKTLQRMKIVGFDNFNPPEEEVNQSCQESSLRSLTIEKSHCFFSHGRTNLVLGFWKHYFAALQDLTIRGCDGLVYWPEEELRSLKCLKTLLIYDCKSLTGSLPAPSPQTPTPRGEDSLPQLESLNIRNCPELVQIPISSSRLKTLYIRNCPKLPREGLAGLTNLTELVDLWIVQLTNWRALPDSMGHLPSLEELEIRDCPGIESFPEGLQQRLPSLQILRIKGCPALQRRCSRGGTYWHLVSPIPRLDIEQEEPESILTRLLPVCGRS